MIDALNSTEMAFFDESSRLRNELDRVKIERDKLNIDLMHESAKASEAREELKRCKLEWEIVADQTGHNLCWAAVARALKATIGHTGKYPDPENVTPEQFAQGCVAYHCDLFPDCGVRLVVIPKDVNDKGVLTPEESEKAKRALGFSNEDKDV